MLESEEQAAGLRQDIATPAHCKRNALSLEFPSEEDVPFTWSDAWRKGRDVAAFVGGHRCRREMVQQKVRRRRLFESVMPGGVSLMSCPQTDKNNKPSAVGRPEHVGICTPSLDAIP